MKFQLSQELHQSFPPSSGSLLSWRCRLHDTWLQSPRVAEIGEDLEVRLQRWKLMKKTHPPNKNMQIWCFFKNLIEMEWNIFSLIFVFFHVAYSKSVRICSHSYPDTLYPATRPSMGLGTSEEEMSWFVSRAGRWFDPKTPLYPHFWISSVWQTSKKWYIECDIVVPVINLKWVTFGMPALYAPSCLRVTASCTQSARCCWWYDGKAYYCLWFL